MRLVGSVSEGSGDRNEDAAGYILKDGQVTAAWVFDGVTGINHQHYLPASSDAVWLVERAGEHLRVLAGLELTLPQLLEQVVANLERDWRAATAGVELPPGYDPPAACLLLVKRYNDGWLGLRLGDSILLVENDKVRVVHPPRSDLGSLETYLRDEARRRRASGPVDFKELLREFHPRLMASRRARNTAENHSILVADRSALNCPEYLELGWPESLLLCTDGFYRAVDTYGFADDVTLMARCKEEGGEAQVLSQIRAIEAGDPTCQRYLRFKPADDATALTLVSD